MGISVESPGVLGKAVRVLEVLAESPRTLAELVEAGSRSETMTGMIEAFDLMDKATRRLTEHEEEGALRVSALPSFAARWLLPRLPRFREQHPDIDILISANERLSDLETEGIDVGLRFGRGHYPGLTSHRLMDDRRLPVCSPALIQGPKPLRTPEDLKHHVLLHDDIAEGVEADWKEWLQFVGLSGIDASRGPGFSDSAMVLAAAIAGQGLAAGLLVQPFGPAVRARYEYWFVTTRRSADYPKVRAFREWVAGEAADTEAKIHALADELGEFQAAAR